MLVAVPAASLVELKTGSFHGARKDRQKLRYLPSQKDSRSRGRGLPLWLPVLWMNLCKRYHIIIPYRPKWRDGSHVLCG